MLFGILCSFFHLSTLRRQQKSSRKSGNTASNVLCAREMQCGSKPHPSEHIPLLEPLLFLFPPDCPGKVNRNPQEVKLLGRGGASTVPLMQGFDFLLHCELQQTPDNMKPHERADPTARRCCSRAEELVQQRADKSWVVRRDFPLFGSRELSDQISHLMQLAPQAPAFKEAACFMPSSFYIFVSSSSAPYTPQHLLRLGCTPRSCPAPSEPTDQPFLYPNPLRVCFHSSQPTPRSCHCCFTQQLLQKLHSTRGVQTNTSHCP